MEWQPPPPSTVRGCLVFPQRPETGGHMLQCRKVDSVQPHWEFERLAQSSQRTPNYTDIVQKPNQTKVKFTDLEFAEFSRWLGVVFFECDFASCLTQNADAKSKANPLKPNETFQF